MIIFRLVSFVSSFMQACIIPFIKCLYGIYLRTGCICCIHHITRYTCCILGREMRITKHFSYKISINDEYKKTTILTSLQVIFQSLWFNDMQIEMIFAQKDFLTDFPHVFKELINGIGCYHIAA